MLASYAAVFAAVFGINLMPAFGPPTWAVLVLFKLHRHLNPAALVLIGSVAAGVGRYCLALATRRVRRRLRPERLANLRAAGSYLIDHRGRSVLGLALFAVSPLPSAQLFEAAGLLDVPLVPITVAFFAGRVVSYSLYIGAASLAERSLGSVFRSALTSPAGIAVQVVMLLTIFMLARVDWATYLHRHQRASKPRPGPNPHNGDRAEETGDEP